MRRKSNYGEKTITKFFNRRLFDALEEPMKDMHFPIGCLEKRFQNQKYRFDIYFYNIHGKPKKFVIVESEFKGWHQLDNLKKLEKMKFLDWDRRTKILFFQIFSPMYSKSIPRLEEKKACIRKGLELDYDHNNFHYYPLEIFISKPVFLRILERFQKDKYSANYYYGRVMKKEISRLAEIIIKTTKYNSRARF